MTADVKTVLDVRLFGFGVPYRAALADGGVEPQHPLSVVCAEDLTLSRGV